eukprot:scaffold1547_cov197-Alexandrium_tamarense.AAC.2
MALMSLLEGENDEVKGQVLVKVGDTGGTGVACCVVKSAEKCVRADGVFSQLGSYPICERYLVIKSTINYRRSGRGRH